MATKELVTRVWIEPGCIVCDACENAAPTVFHVTEDTCIIRPEAMAPEFTKPISQDIIDAAEECPVDVIKFETTPVEVADDASAEAGETAKTSSAQVEEPDEAPKKAAASKSPESASSQESKADKVEKAARPEKRDKPDEAMPVKKEEEKAAPAKKVASADPEVSVAGQGDPAIQALLRAAMTRGGTAAIARKSESVPESARDWHQKDPKDLPPDARQVRLIEEARKRAASAPDPKRRAVAGSAALGLGWLAFGGGTALSVGPAFIRFMMPNVLEEPDPRVRVGKLQRYIEMQVGEVIENYKPQGIWMIRTKEGIAALSIICTHLGCIPNWLPNDKKFKCPCHGSGYHPNGINFEGPTPRPLERFRLYIESGIVIVDKSKKYQYELGQWGLPGSILEV